VIVWDLTTGQQVRTIAGLREIAVPPSSLAFSPDGDVLCVATGNGVQLRSLANGEKLREFYDHRISFRCVAFSPDGKLVAAGGKPGPLPADKRLEISVWDISSKERILALDVGGQSVEQLAFSCDGKELVAVGTRYTGIWDLATGELGARSTSWILPLAPAIKQGAVTDQEKKREVYAVSPDQWMPKLLGAHDAAVTCVVCSADGNTLASADAGGTIRLWQSRTIDNWLTFTTPHLSEVTALAFSPDGKTLLSASADSIVRVWKVERPTLRAPIALERSVACLALSPDFRWLAACTYGNVMVWDIDERREVWSREDNVEERTGIQPFKAFFSVDGKTLFVWAAFHGEYAFSTATGEEQDLHPQPLACAPNSGFMLYSRRSRRAVALTVEFPKSEELAFTTDYFSPSTRTLDGPTHATAIAVSPDGSMVAGPAYETIPVWDTKTGQRSASLEGHKDGVYDLAFSPDGRTLASAGDRTVKLWETDSGQLRATLRGHTDQVHAIAFSPDGKTLASASGDWALRSGGGRKGHGELRLWDPLTGQERAAFTEFAEPVIDLAFSPDGRVLVSAIGKEIRFWDAGGQAWSANH